MPEIEERPPGGHRRRLIDHPLVAEGRRLRAALQESEERFHLLFHTVPDPIALSRLEDGLVLDVNEGFTRFTGYSREDAIGRTGAELGAWIDSGSRPDLAEALRAGGAVEDPEARFRRKDGSIATVRISARPARLRGQACVLTVVHEAAQLRAAELLLTWERLVQAALADLARSVVAAATLPIADVARQVLDHARSLTGSGLGFVGVTDPRTGRLVRSAVSRESGAGGRSDADGGGTVDPAIWEIGGYCGWVLANRTPLLTNHPEARPPAAGSLFGEARIERFVAAPAIAGDELVGLIALANAARDYTERDLRLVERFADLYAIAIRRRRDEAALQTLSRAVEQSPSSVVITDLDGTIEYVNPAFTRITGYTAAEAIGRNPRILKAGEMPPEAYAEMWATVTAGHVWRGEFHNRKKDGSLFWEAASIAPIKDEGGTLTHYVAVKEDITRRKLYEIELQAAKDQAEASSRAKSAFLANMSHELRTPLNSILGFAQIMDQKLFGPPGDPRYEQYVGHILESGHHLLALINDILDLSKIEAGRMEVHDEILETQAVIRSAAAMVRPAADAAGLRLAMELAEALPRLRADGRMLRQILLNLLSNAVKFTPRGGRVTLRADTDPAGAVVIAVADTGIGMTSQEIAEAMIPFSRIDNPVTREHEGTGLGLPLTKALIELHGGALEVASEPGCGTILTVKFPPDRSVSPPEEMALVQSPRTTI